MSLVLTLFWSPSASVRQWGQSHVAVSATRVAHKLYPLRVRVVNVVTGDVEWEPIAYIPIVRKQKEPAAERRARARRHSILQRVLYMAFRTTIAASRHGVKHEMGGKTYVAFPRILLYVCDQPEEKAVLCIKGGNCKFPCSSCLVPADLAGAPAALKATERSAVETLKRQVNAEAQERLHHQTQSRSDLEAHDSAHSRLPALAGMFGLSTDPFLLYKTVGFDCLHVRGSRSVLWVCASHSAIESFLLMCSSGLTSCLVLLSRFISHIGCVVAQVMDLGVTRMLVHRLVRVFPHICDGHYPLCETIAATFRVANMRLEYMGRRSKASHVPPGYVICETLTASCFFSLG